MIAIYLILFTIGCISLYYGIKNSIRFNNLQDIGEYKLEDNIFKININEIGLYSLSFVGGKYVQIPNESEVEIRNNQNENINLSENKFKYRFMYKNKACVEYFDFQIVRKGTFSLVLRNSNKIIVKSSLLNSKRIFESPINHDKIKILIKETIPNDKRLLYLLSIIVGIILISFSIIQIIIN